MIVQQARTSVDEITDRLISIIEQTDFEFGIGNVIALRRRYRDAGEFYEAMVQNHREPGVDYIKGWEVYWEGAQDARGGKESGIGLGRARRHHIFRADGFMSYHPDLATEREFNAMVIAIMNNLIANVVIDNVSEDSYNVIIGAPSVETDMVEFGDSGCFAAQILIPVSEDFKLPKGPGSLR